MRNDGFDAHYPMKHGIVNCLPLDMQETIEPDLTAKHFFDVHKSTHRDLEGWQYAKDPTAMAHLQREFYDRMAVAFEEMDNADKRSGGVFWWKIHRLFKYDNNLLSDGQNPRGSKLLFIGAGNCRIAALFAKAGWDVTATDISMQMLRIGREREGAIMRYVAHDAERKFPFASNYYDAVYSLCVMNHIVNWDNYVREKLRCLKPGGLLLERMPNAHLWKFWKGQDILYDGVEARALDCYPKAAHEAFSGPLGFYGDPRDVDVWTHDRQLRLNYSKHLLGLQKMFYLARCAIEDKLMFKTNEKGIYTMVLVEKPTNEGGELI